MELLNTVVIASVVTVVGLLTTHYTKGRLDEQDRRVAELRAEMVARLGRQEDRFDEQNAHFDARIDEQNIRFDARFDEQNIRLDARFDEQNIRLDARIDEQNAHFDARIDEQNIHFDARFDEQNARLEKRFDEVKADIRELRTEMATMRSDLTRVALAVGAGGQPQAG
jgi:uncharacterized protein YhaN